MTHDNNIRFDLNKALEDQQEARFASGFFAGSADAVVMYVRVFEFLDAAARSMYTPEL